MDLSFEERFELIKRNTTEIIGEEELKELLRKKKKPVVYLGTAVTGSPHVAYLFWAMKLADFAKAGFEVKILLADVHGALDNTPWKILEKRYKYYEKIIPLLFESLGIKKSQLEFVKGSSYQLSKNYLLDLLKLSTYASVHDALKAASEVVKHGENPKTSGLIYPLMQALDEEYLGVDVQYGGMDQRKIFVLAGELLPKIDYKKRIYVLTPILPGLIGKKMSSSEPKSKMDLLDDEETIRSKIHGAECVAGNSDNGLMTFLKYIIFVLKKDSNEKVIIERDKKYGGDLIYENYEKLEKDFTDKKIHPLDLKNTVAKEINELLKPIRKNKTELSKLYKDAYL
jgi:tyrosyl-tRNA synthetase